MASHLQSLLDLRHDAESHAAAALARASAAHAARLAEQARLDARWRRALAALTGGTEELDAPVATAVQALARERHRGALEAAVAHAARARALHRQGPLAVAAATEEAARVALDEARRAAASVAKLVARAEDAAAQVARRRSEDSASDLANAASLRGR